MRKGKLWLLIITIVTVLGGWTVPASADVQIDPEREALFWASHRMSQHKQAAPRGTLAMFSTTVGSDGTTPVNWGGRLELALSEQVWFSLEAVHVGDAGIDGYASLKLYPVQRGVSPFYFGAGAKLSGDTDYQAFMGVEILRYVFVEAKYVGHGGDSNAGQAHLAAGYILPF